MSEQKNSGTLGLLLKRLLQERSLSIRKCSELTQIDPATVSRIISGKRKATPEHLQRFADCLEVPVSELFAAAGYSVNRRESDIHASIDNIQDILESSNVHYNQFSVENVERELAKYEQYAQTEEGKETILRQFETKLQKISGTGPFIHQLKDMYEKFRINKGAPWEMALIGSALIYFISPVDVIPDYIFPIGYIDDAIAVKLIANALQTPKFLKSSE